MTGSTLLEHKTALDEGDAFNVLAQASRTRLDLGEPSIIAVKPATEPAATPTPEEKPSPHFSFPSVGPMYVLSLNRLEATNSATVQFSSRTHDAQPYSPLSVSLEALSRAASRPDAGAWLDAAATLKRDAVRLRNSSAYGRHAAVLLTLADALTFTRPADPTLRPGASDVLQRGLAVLTDPFVSTDAERDLMRNLLSHGWNIAPASEGLPPAR
jgi:hypothetical protein